MEYLSSLLEDEEALTFSRFLERLYPIPRDTVSLEDFARRRHQDLADFEDEALDVEALRCQIRRCLELNPAHQSWLQARIGAVGAERQARRRQAAEPIRLPVGRAGAPRTPEPAPETLSVAFTAAEAGR